MMLQVVQECLLGRPSEHLVGQIFLRMRSYCVIEPVLVQTVRSTTSYGEWHATVRCCRNSSVHMIPCRQL